jgi:hypothetical protein
MIWGDEELKTTKHNKEQVGTVKKQDKKQNGQKRRLQ